MRKRTSFDIVGPDGRRVTVRPRSDADTVGDLMAAFGHAGPTAIRVDGHAAAAGQRLVDLPGLRTGSRVEVGTGTASPAVDPETPGAPGAREAVVEVAVIAGPSCRGWTPLGAGRHTIGSSVHCSIRLVDPLAELHHGLVDVDGSGDVRFTQLTGRVPARVDGEPCGPAHPIPPGAVLEVGASLLTLRPIQTAGARFEESAPAGSIVAGPDPWRLVVRRGPVGEVECVWPKLVAPDQPGTHPSPPATGLVGALVAVGGALVVASVMGQMMFALFALIGAVASLATWAVGLVSAARRRRRGRRDHRAQLDEFRTAVVVAMAGWREHHRRRHRTITEAIDEGVGGRTWERRPGHPPELRATVGLGALASDPPIDRWSSLPTDVVADLDRCAVVDLQPAPVLLRPGDGLAVHGGRDSILAIVRSLVLQLATWTGPADWQLLVVTHDPDRWAWAGWLPHATSGDGFVRVVTPDEVEEADDRLAADRITVLVTDEVALFDARTGPTRRLVAWHEAIVVVAVRRECSVPSICGSVLRVGSTGWADWTSPAPSADFPTGIRIAGIDERTAATAARRLAALVDPEDLAASASAIPITLRFADLDEHDPDPDRDCDGDAVARIADRWLAGGADPAPCAPIGISADGVIDVDLVRDGPHGLIAGTTGSGKSELLRTLVLALATRCSPDHLTFVLVDYKGGSTFDACARLPHAVGLVTDLDDGGAERALVSLEAELRRRERLLRDAGAADLTDYRGRPDAPPLPRLVVVVDEFAALVHELPDFLASLVGIAQRGRSLGVHLLLATQRPSGVVSDDIRANTNLRLALRLHDVADARDVVGDDLPATLPRTYAGRAVLRLGPRELVVFQTAHCTGPVTRPTSGLAISTAPGVCDPPGARPPDGPTELSVLVDAVVAAAERLALRPPHRPWVDPLPPLLDPADVDLVAADGPDEPNGHDSPDGPDEPNGHDGPDGPCAHDVVGLLDDPANQGRRVLRWDPAGGNLALVGPLGSGISSTLVALAAALCRTSSPDELHLYVIDAVGDPLLDGLGSVAHCGAVIRVREVERLHRLLARLDGELHRRHTGTDSSPRVVVLVDGIESLRASLSSIERVETLALLDRVTADGAALGIACAVGGTDVSRIECMDRWVFAGSADATSPPGRVTVASSGLEGQITFGAPGLAALPDRRGGCGPQSVDVLPDRIDRRRLTASWMTGDGPSAIVHLVVGRSAESLDAVALAVPAGDHVLIGGQSRSGKSTALRVLSAAWSDVHPGGRVVPVDRRRPLDLDGLDDGPTLVVVDDADRVDDPSVAALAADHRPDVTLLAAARLESLRTLYGHWTRDVARSRCGLVLTSAGEVDGELLGATLPRRTLIGARPGLGWVVDSGGHRLAQVAV